jgi:hypothetical protein
VISTNSHSEPKFQKIVSALDIKFEPLIKKVASISSQKVHPYLQAPVNLPITPSNPFKSLQKPNLTH